MRVLCHEMRRTFALIIAALFERQLRTWLGTRLPGQERQVEGALWPGLFDFVEKVDPSIKADPVVNELQELHSLANAVRHGNGKSAQKIFEQKPQLWDLTRPQAELQHDLVGNMRIDDAHLARYVRAALRFWYLAGATRPDL
jgi:hypothetical protein